MRLPSFSVIIPTYNSARFIGICLASVVGQEYPKKKLEILVVDNYSQDRTVSITQACGARSCLVKGQPSQGCVQRNLGAEKSTGEYLVFLDHDMVMSPGLLKDVARKVAETNNAVDAWYIPERVIANTAFLSAVRTYEKRCYNGTVINAARIIRRKKFYETDGYDPQLSNGPADWDMDIQLKRAGCTFGMIDAHVDHHEENLSFWKYVTKKKTWLKGIVVYREKWRREDVNVYNSVIKKQFGFFYRFFGVFVERHKWKQLLPNIHLYLTVVLIKLFISLVYLTKKPA